MQISLEPLPASILSGVVACILFASGPASADESEAPDLFADVSSSLRAYPNTSTAMIGFDLGSLWRPSDEKCVHLAGEAFARFGRRELTDLTLKMRTAGGALGALWGAGNADRWFGVGAMFDLGWARVGSRDDFVSSGYLRALFYGRLRGPVWGSLDVRVGHVIAPVTVNDTGIKGPLVGIGVGVVWGDAR